MEGELVEREETPEYRREHALQLTALYMARGATVDEAASKAGIGARTLTRWRGTEEWRNAYRQAQAAIIAEARGGLVALVGRAVRVIGEQLHEEDDERSAKMAKRVETAWKVLRTAGVEIEVAQAERGKTILTRLPAPGGVSAVTTVEQVEPAQPAVTTEPAERREVRRGW